MRRYVLIRDYHSDVPGIRGTGRTGRNELFLLMQEIKRIFARVTE